MLSLTVGVGGGRVRSRGGAACMAAASLFAAVCAGSLQAIYWAAAQVSHNKVPLLRKRACLCGSIPNLRWSCCFVAQVRRRASKCERWWCAATGAPVRVR